jgi:Fe-S-cluster containining protein
LSISLIQDLALLLQLEVAREEENDNFLLYLKQQNGQSVDMLVHQLNNEVSEAIDCTSCGNCCRSLMINVEPGEPEILSFHLNISLPVLKEKYIEESQQGRMIVNTIPCHFLEDNKCTVYEHRFKECHEFPHLHKPGFIKRFPGTLMHYGRCPIIFNVIEILKTLINYEHNKDDE